MVLPSLTKLELTGKRVLLRADLDFDPNDTDNLRLKALIPTLDYLLGKKVSEITILAHRGRPEGVFIESLSLQPFEKVFEKWGVRIEENLRFNPGEEANDQAFATTLSQKGDVYVNEAFAASHREHASIVALPKILPHAAGLHFEKEVDNVLSVLEEPKHPILFLVNGVKYDKIKYIERFIKIADYVLIGGRLPDYIHDTSPLRKDPKVVVASLIPDKEDITIHSIEAFEDKIKQAHTIVVSGPPGKFEEEGHRQGTKRVFEAVAASAAYKLAGGGDTESAIKILGIGDKFNWLSIGGGAMLTLLAEGTLPGIDALITSK